MAFISFTSLRSNLVSVRSLGCKFSCELLALPCWLCASELGGKLVALLPVQSSIRSGVVNFYESFSLSEFVYAKHILLGKSFASLVIIRSKSLQSFVVQQECEGCLTVKSWSFLPKVLQSKLCKKEAMP